MSDQVTINNRRPTILGGQAGLRLMPGANKVSLEVYEANRAIKTFQSWCKLGWVSVRMPESHQANRFAAPAEPEAADALKDLNAGQSKKLIEQTDSVDLLDAWYVKEDRKTVQKAIKAKLAELTSSDEDDAGDDEDDAGDDEGESETDGEGLLGESEDEEISE